MLLVFLIILFCFLFFFSVNEGRYFPLEVSEQLKSFELSVFKAFNRISQIFKFNMCKAGLPGKFSATPDKNSFGLLRKFCRLVVDLKNVNHLTFFACTANYSARIPLLLNINPLLIQ